MTGTVFANQAAARLSLEKNKFVYARYAVGDKQFKRENAPHDSGAYLNDYATIAAFLCNKADFERALAEVSARLWDEYRNYPQKFRNKFSCTLGKVATGYGFQFQNRLQLNTAPIGLKLLAGDPLLGQHVRARLFWKDSMDSRHGEHSHSLQWLAIAQGVRTTQSVPELYANSVNYWAPSADSARALVVPLWSWLADSFPPDMKKFATELVSGETLETDSYRSPQLIMDYLLAVKGNRALLNDHFVANYLYHRYNNRKWLSEDNGVVQSIQEKDIKAHRRDEQDKLGWHKNKSGVRAERAADFKPGQHATTLGAQKYTHTFHGKAGQMIFYYTE